MNVESVKCFKVRRQYRAGLETQRMTIRILSIMVHRKTLSERGSRLAMVCVCVRQGGKM